MKSAVGSGSGTMNTVNKLGTLISVCGLQRSGTTLLGAMLGNREDAFYVGEIQARFRPTRTHHFEIDPVCGESPCPKWEALRQLRAREFHRGVCQRLGVDFVVDSSKNLAWILDSRRWAARTGLRVLNVLIWKHPKDLAYSHWKRGHDPIQWRDGYIGTHRLVLEEVPSIVAVNYRDLSQDPAKVLAGLGGLVGMRYQDDQEEFWNRTQHFLFGSDSIQLQSENRRGAIRATQLNPEFEEVWASLEARVRADTELHELVATLSNWVPREDRRPARFWLPPLWYLRSRATSVARRWIPSKWRPSRFRAGVDRVPS